MLARLAECGKRVAGGRFGNTAPFHAGPRRAAATNPVP